MDTLLDEDILRATDPEWVADQEAENLLRDLSLGITPLRCGDPRDAGFHARKCDGCGLSESPSQKFATCSRCRLVCYCTADCQRAHWSEAHKTVCSQLTGEAEAEGKKIAEEVSGGDVSSLITIQRNDAVYTMAVRHGLFAAMEKLFRQESEGRCPHRGCYSWSQDIIINTFKGNRDVIERYTCACPVRSKEYILSSPTAWDSVMDALLHLAQDLNKEEFRVPSFRDEQEVAVAHRAARDAFATIELALIYRKVAKALFFRSKSVGKRSQSEARNYALNTMAPKLKAFFRNGGEGFAPDHIDRNQTIQANVFQFTAMLSYWYRTLEVDPENPNAFADAMQFNVVQETMFETLARPLGEGSIELGRALTMEETREWTLKANREYQQKRKSGKRGGKKKGGKKKNRR